MCATHADPRAPLRDRDGGIVEKSAVQPGMGAAPVSHNVMSIPEAWSRIGWASLLYCRFYLDFTLLLEEDFYTIWTLGDRGRLTSAV